MSPDPALAPVPPAPTAPTAFVGRAAAGPVDTPVPVGSLADYRATFAPAEEAPSPLDHAVELFFANGGTDAVVVRTVGEEAEHVVPSGGAGGLRALTQPFSVLVLPGLTSASPRAVEAALRRCTQERAVLLLDLPADADARAAALHADRVRGARGRVAAYHPWLLVRGAAVAPSGAVAGVLGGTPADRGTAQAPLEEETRLQGVDGLAADLTGEEAEELAAHGVNALRDLPDRRRVVSGGRLLGATTSTAPSSRFLSVRRLTDHVLTSLDEGMAFVAGRRGDPGLADLVRRRAEDFLARLWQQGALAGSTAAEAFSVRCDRSTTSAADEAAGLMVLRVGLATVRPAEMEVHDLVLETSTAGGPELLEAPLALARATSLARERLSVVHRETLAPLVTGDPQETRRRLERVFESAAHAGSVLLLETSDGVLGRSRAVPAGRRDGGVVRLLQQLSRDTGVPYVLGRRH